MSDDDLGDEAFPFSTSREIRLGYATVRATRLTYVGELGWELYVPTEFAVGVYEELLRQGEPRGAVPAGYYAIESLRLEKGYRAFGRALTPDHNPVEAGLTFACKLGSDVDFLGRRAVEQAKGAGARRRLVSLVASDPDRRVGPLGKLPGSRWRRGARRLGEPASDVRPGKRPNPAAGTAHLKAQLSSAAAKDLASVPRGGIVGGDGCTRRREEATWTRAAPMATSTARTTT